MYVSDQQSATAVAGALGELEPETFGATAVSVVTVEPTYVAGEETAAVRANQRRTGETDRQAAPAFEEGVSGLPTMVSNVETLANLPFIHEHGADGVPRGRHVDVAGHIPRHDHRRRSARGTVRDSAWRAFSDLLTLHGLPADAVRGVLMGGYFAGLLNSDMLDATLDHESIRRLGSGLGCGAISILTEDCPVAVAASVMSYFDRENAGQCGSCFNGTAAMAAVTSALRDGVATKEDLTRLERWSVVLRGRGACGTLDGATNVAASLLVRFPQLVARHLGTIAQRAGPAPSTPCGPTKWRRWRE